MRCHPRCFAHCLNGCQERYAEKNAKVPPMPPPELSNANDQTRRWCFVETMLCCNPMCRLSAKKILLRKVSLPRADQERHVPDTLWSSTSSKFSNTKDTISMSSTKARVAESVLDKQFKWHLAEDSVFARDSQVYVVECNYKESIVRRLSESRHVVLLILS